VTGFNFVFEFSHLLVCRLTCLCVGVDITACNVLYGASMDTESLTGPEAVTKATEFTLQLEPAPKTTVVHFKVSSEGITLTDLRHRSSVFPSVS